MAMKRKVGFDHLLDAPITLKDSVGVSINGNHIVTSKYGKGTYIEHSNEYNLPPNDLLLETADSIGFFGRDQDIIALSIKTDLLIIDRYKLELLDKKKIRAGSLFVPDSGGSEKIGFVDPHGQTCVLYDDGRFVKSSLHIGKNTHYEVLWSNTVTPVGYKAVEDESVILYIRSRKEDTGVTITSTWGMYVHTVWWNPSLERHEAYITTIDNKNVLQRVTSTTDEPPVTDVLTLEPDVDITDVITLSDGRPILLTGIRGTQIITESIPPDTNTAEMIKGVLTGSADKQEINPVGNTMYINWRQNPVCPPHLELVNYGAIGHPTTSIQANKPDNIVSPPVNKIVTLVTKDKHELNYRFLSPFDHRDHLVQSTVIIPDYEGSISSGEYSPTVRMCYDAGLAVAIVPIRLIKNKFSMNDYKLDLIDVCYDMKSKDVSSSFTVLGNGEYASAALAAMQDRRSSITEAILVDPLPDTLKKIKKKHTSSITVVDTGEEQTLFPANVFTHHMPAGSGQDFRQEIAAVITHG